MRKKCFMLLATFHMVSDAVMNPFLRFFLRHPANALRGPITDRNCIPHQLIPSSGLLPVQQVELSVSLSGTVCLTGAISTNHRIFSLVLEKAMNFRCYSAYQGSPSLSMRISYPSYQHNYVQPQMTSNLPLTIPVRPHFEINSLSRPQHFVRE
jgi:hypothetical protein